jgi:DNA-directed RNA polymerase specialized sigma24 family protein/ribosome-associated translation inhibitor RaiA
MNVHVSYKDRKAPEVEKEVNHQIEKLGRRLQVFRPELVHLKASVEQNPARTGTTVSLNLRLPSGQMAVQEVADNAPSAVKAAFDDLVQQINKHKDLLRSSHKWQRRRAESGRAPTLVPFEETMAAVHVPMASSDDIRSYVNVNLPRLARFVERELSFRETDEEFAVDSISKDEVIDEVIARALDEESEKPERVALEPWLYRLAIQAIGDLASGNREDNRSVHLGDSARKKNVRASDEHGLQYHQPDESLTEENVIADRRLSTPEDLAYSDEMVMLVQFALEGADRTDREAFILHAIEGFSVEEIGVITARKPEVVKASIEAAGERLRRSVPLAKGFKEKTLQTAAVK